jgi:cytochrome c oxidase cbb3-type subunit 3
MVRGRLKTLFAASPERAASARETGTALAGPRCVWAFIVLTVTASCKREERLFHVSQPNASVIEEVNLVELHPGGTPPPAHVKNPYEENAYALSEGKNLYSSYNCVGCHAHGGGGMGPPLMDAKWIYGSAPEQILATIIEGRPNGMPSFRGKIPANQVWQLVAYVRSLSGLVSKNAAPARDDHMHLGPPENSRKEQNPKQSFTPPSSEMPK